MDTKTLELSIINSVLFDKNDNDYALSSLKPEHFFSDLGRTGWEIIQDRIKNGKDFNPVIFDEELRRRNLSITEYMIEETFGSCESFAKELISSWKLLKTKEYYLLMHDEIKNGESIENALGSFLNKTMDISTTGQDEDTDLRPAVIEWVQQVSNKISGKQTTGYSWGITEIDDAAGGIEPGRIYVIAALKKTGKSRFIISIMDFQAKQKTPMLFISLEMTKTDVVSWLATKNTGVNFDNKFLPNNAAQKAGIASASISEYPLRVSELPADINKIEGEIRKHVKEFGTKIVFIDYFQQIRKGNLKGQSMASVMDMEACRLQQIAKELKVAIVYLSQMPVEAERIKQDGKKAGIGYLKGCGGIAEAADVIMVMDNESRNSSEKGATNQTISIMFWGRRCASGTEVKITANLALLDFKAQDNIHFNQEI